MIPLATLALRCGYKVLIDASPTCLELTGNGRWHIFSRECLRFVKCSSYPVRDHVSIIMRDPLGGRELRDVGVNGERRAKLPSTRYKWKRTTIMAKEVSK